MKTLRCERADCVFGDKNIMDGVKSAIPTLANSRQLRIRRPALTNCRIMPSHYKNVYTLRW